MYKSLQASRAIAAILVLLFHLGRIIAAEKYFGITGFSIPFSFGSAGVEFFFVLSGFIIFTAHQDDIFKPYKLASYIKKRFLRIYPTYWIIFLSVFLLAITSTAWRNTVPHDIFIIFKSLLLIPQEKSIVWDTGAPVLIVAWTLQYEIFFYFFFAVLILNRWLSIISSLGLLYIYANYTGVLSAPFPLSFLSQDYIVLFVMGMVISVACSSKKVVASRPVFYVGTGTVMFLIVGMDTVLNLNLLSKWGIILYGLASSLIIFGLVQEEDKGRIILNNNWLQILGDSSYALYLIHYPLSSILCKLSLLIQLHKLGIIGAMIAYIAIFCICLISSVIFYFWIEKPMTTYFRNRLAK
ncbi:MAG: acyltransferase [Methylococcales bacterium]